MRIRRSRNERHWGTAKPKDDFHGGDDGELVELKIILRDVPEKAENGHPIDGEPFSPTPEEVALSKTPVKRTKAEVVAAIFDVLESGEQRTATIAGAIGRSERSVRRDLAEMRSDGKVSVVKKGVYRLHRSVLWTEADNEVLINELLAVYTALIDACKGGVKKIFGSQEISDTEKFRCVQDVQWLCCDDRSVDEAVVAGASRLAHESASGESRYRGEKGSC